MLKYRTRPKSMGCQRLKESLQAQMRALAENEDFLKHKWYRSEEAKKDVGFVGTLNSFAMLPVYDDFARYFRDKYCSYDCDCREECAVWKTKLTDKRKNK